MLVDDGAGRRWAAAFAATGSGENGSDDLLAQHKQGGEVTQAGSDWLVMPASTDAVDEVLAVKLLQVVGGLPGRVWTSGNIADLDHEFRTGESPGVERVSGKDVLSVGNQERVSGRVSWHHARPR